MPVGPSSVWCRTERARGRVGKAGGADPGGFGGPEDEAVRWALTEGLGLGTARLPTGPLGGGAESGTWEGSANRAIAYASFSN